jgi:uncharacterized protein (DUF1697 family)
MQQQRYAALLRGINVGRAKRIAMADLRALVTGLGFSDVRTLLNSGNVVFTAPPRNRRTPAQMEEVIERAMTATLGVTAKVTVLAAEELEEILAENPLPAAVAEPSRFLVAVLRRPADRAGLEALAREPWTWGTFALGRRAGYLWCREGILESPLPEAVGRVLKDGVTSRNWATLTKLKAII